MLERARCSVTHDGESKSSWSLVAITVALNRYSNQYVTFFKVDSASTWAIFWVYQICLAIAVCYLEATHISITFLPEYFDVCDSLPMQGNILDSMSRHSKHIWRLACIVCQLATSKIKVSISPSAKGNLFNLHLFYISTAFQVWNLRPCL